MRNILLCELMHDVSDLTVEEAKAIREEKGDGEFSIMQKKSSKFWDKLEEEIDSKDLDYGKVRIYQDGWPGVDYYKQPLVMQYSGIRKSASSDEDALHSIVELAKAKQVKDSNYNVEFIVKFLKGEISDKELTKIVVKKKARDGSRNYKLLEKLLEQGATLEASEDPELLMEEKAYLTRITYAETFQEKKLVEMGYQRKKPGLLKKRTMCFANRINKTLREGELGLVFFGIAHNIMPYLSKDILEKRYMRELNG